MLLGTVKATDELSLKGCYIRVWSGQRKHTGLSLERKVLNNFGTLENTMTFNLTKDGDPKYYNNFQVMERFEVIEIWQRQ